MLFLEGWKSMNVVWDWGGGGNGKERMVWMLFCIPFFFGFSQCFLKAFNQRLITVHNGWAHSGKNRWLREFFQSVGALT